MDSQVTRILTLASSALVFVIVLVIVFVIVFLISGMEELLIEMLHSAVKGEFLGISFTVGGPFGMWVIATFVLVRLSRTVSLRKIRVYLLFPSPDPRKPPSHPADFLKAECWYSVFSNGTEILSNKKVTILTDKYSGPFIFVSIPDAENPAFQVRLKYEGNEWISDGLSPRIRSVDLR